MLVSMTLRRGLSLSLMRRRTPPGYGAASPRHNNLPLHPMLADKFGDEAAARRLGDDIQEASRRRGRARRRCPTPAGRGSGPPAPAIRRSARSSFSKSPSSQGRKPANASQDSSKYRSAEAGRPGSAVCLSVAEASDASSLSAYAARRETAIE